MWLKAYWAPELCPMVFATQTGFTTLESYHERNYVIIHHYEHKVKLIHQNVCFTCMWLASAHVDVTLCCSRCWNSLIPFVGALSSVLAHLLNSNEWKHCVFCCCCRRFCFTHDLNSAWQPRHCSLAVEQFCKVLLSNSTFPLQNWRICLYALHARTLKWHQPSIFFVYLKTSSLLCNSNLAHLALFFPSVIYFI